MSDKSIATWSMPERPPEGVYFLAEIGINHNGSRQQALKMVRSAADCGADGIKLQSYVTEDFLDRESPAFDIFKSCELSAEDHRAVAELCSELGIEFISTPLTLSWVPILDDLGAAAFKIASCDLTYYDLIAAAAEKDKPLIVSTGASTGEEIAALLDQDFMRGKAVILLHCVSSYPPRMEDMNLRCIAAMKESISLPVGFSDHSVGAATAIAAVAQGAVLIEKHFTLSHDLPVPDRKVSMDPPQFKAMVEACTDVYRALGDGGKRVAPGESSFRDKARRGLYLRRPLKKGERLSPDNAVYKRPANAIRPDNVRLTGSTAWRAKTALDNPLTPEQLERS